MKFILGSGIFGIWLGGLNFLIGFPILMVFIGVLTVWFVLRCISDFIDYMGEPQARRPGRSSNAAWDTYKRNHL